MNLRIKVGRLAHSVGRLAHVYCVVSQLHMLSLLGSIPAAYTIIGTSGTVL